MTALQEEIKQAVIAANAPLHAEIRELRQQVAELKGAEDDLISLADAATALGKHKNTLRAWAAEGRVEVIRKGRSIYFRREAIFGG